jgi:hypothetical protein
MNSLVQEFFVDLSTEVEEWDDAEDMAIVTLLDMESKKLSERNMVVLFMGDRQIHRQ